MATQNTLTSKASTAFDNKIVEYDCGGEQIRLSAKVIKDYLVNGNGAVTDQEVAMFLNLCKYQHLNPFVRDAYLIKFGTQPATMVTSKEALAKRARRNKTFAGHQAGVVIQKENGEIEQRMGTLTLKGETLVGGWAKVYIRDDEVPMEITVSLNEYIGRKGDGTVNAQWANKPATMIRKVAMAQALREAFPEDCGGMYAQEEMMIGEDLSLPETPLPQLPLSQLPIQESEFVGASLIEDDPLQ